MPKLRVLKHGGFPYGVGEARRNYGKGQVFLAKQKDARMLIAAKLAEEVVEGAPVKAPKAKASAAATKTRASTAKATTNRAGTRRGTYNRSDMRAK